MDKIRVAKDLYASFQTRNFEQVLAVLSKDVEWGEPSNPHNPAGGTRHGHDGFLEWLQVGNAAEEILVLELRRFLSDDEAVAVTGFVRCLVRSTNKIYETDFVHLIVFKDNEIVKFQEFFDTYTAGEAFRTT